MKRRSLFLALVGLLPSPARPHAANVVHVTQEDRSAGHGITRMRLVAAPHRLRSMPCSRKQNRLIESRIDKLADSGDRKPGKYLLVCNKPGHYRGGMHTWLTVTR